MISMKYLGGIKAVMYCAHSGMEDIGVSNPLIKTKIMMKKNMMNMACCMVFEKLDTISPKLEIANVKRKAFA